MRIVDTAGPVSGGVLARRYGCRPVAAAGALLLCCGYLGMAFSPSIYIMYLFSSLCGKTSLCMVIVNIIVLMLNCFKLLVFQWWKYK